MKIWGWLGPLLAVGNLYLLSQVWYLRMKLARYFPKSTVNVIDGFVLPSPSDPRWESKQEGSWHQYWKLGAITVTWIDSRSIYNQAFDTWRVTIGNKQIEGFKVKRYWRAIEREYVQRQALKAMDE